MNGINETSADFDFKAKVNKPQLQKGMIPITYEEENKKWVVADESNSEKSWYDYDRKKWANICTVGEENANLRTAKVGEEIPESAMTTMFVWIPRYAYSIEKGYRTSNTETVKQTNNKSEKNIEIKFLVGNTNRDIELNKYEKDYDETKVEPNTKTPMIIHPAFYAEEKAISGIWVAKFEASGTTKINGEEKAVGNYENGTQLINPGTDTYVKILPNVVSWRNIKIGDCQYRSIQMGKDTLNYGFENANTHLIKNSEWGAVAYLSYSKYGQVPQINGAGNNETQWHDIYTGAGPVADGNESLYKTYTNQKNGYNTNLGILASTTGNVYGIYDMSGGSWEYVATYLDNKNSNLGYGNTSLNTEKYFDNNYELKAEYENLWEKIEVSEEERSNKINVVGKGEYTQSQLWNYVGTNEEDNKIHNTARKSLTEKIFKNMWKNKGIGVNETTTDYSYNGFVTTGRAWLKDITDTKSNTATGWNRDYALIGYASGPFVLRGGGASYGSYAGVLYTIVSNGYGYADHSFRVSLVP